MAEHAPTSVKKRRGPIALLGSAIRNLTVRFYALAILLVVVWTGYTAVAFLVRSVFQPTHVPPQFLTWQSALSGGKLQPANATGEVNVPRAPLEHYHRVERTLPPDEHNGCLTSGCHSALAHTQRKEIRAFANLHATFLACTLCHDATIDGPTEAMWVSFDAGEPTDPPAVLRLMQRFEAEAGKIESAPAEFNAVVAELLPEVTRISRDPALDYLQTEINTSQPGSPVWRHAITQLRNELPNHVRGEYGCKLVKKMPAAENSEYNRRLAELARQYQTSKESIPERKKLHDEIHRGILPKPAACLACHGGEPARLNFESLGYSPLRAGELRSSSIARQMQSIQRGEPFHLPGILTPAQGQ